MRKIFIIMIWDENNDVQYNGYNLNENPKEYDLNRADHLLAIFTVLVELQQTCRSVLAGEAASLALVRSHGLKLTEVTRRALDAGIPADALIRAFEIADIACTSKPAEVTVRFDQLRRLESMIDLALEEIWM